MKTRKVVALGALIGTTFALFFAPQKGEHVRMQMKKASMRGGDNLEPLKKGYKDLFSEFFRVIWSQLPFVSEKNPFTVTSLKK
ncbi:hypothetical protein C0416_05270 [bacterium]|nr:hypothetical protein [bacterium]